jgi:hypothetical protein
MGKLSMNSGVLLGLVMVAISFIVFPVVLDGANEILNHPNLTDYTGLEQIAAIGPMLVFVVMLFGGLGLTIYSGIKGKK